MKGKGVGTFIIGILGFAVACVMLTGTSVYASDMNIEGNIIQKSTELPAAKITVKKVKTVTLSTTTYNYTGKEKRPKVTAIDKDGNTIAKKHYTVKYSDNVKVGTGTVTVSFDDLYGNKVVTKKIIINPARATKFKVTGGSDSYVAVQWKMNIENVDGYELQYSTDKSFKNVQSLVRRTSWTKARKEADGDWVYYGKYSDYFGTILTDVTKGKLTTFVFALIKLRRGKKYTLNGQILNQLR